MPHPPSHTTRIAALALLVMVVLPAPGHAQVVITPTFSVAQSGVGASEPQWVVTGVDAAADESGNVLFFWSEVLPVSVVPPRALVSRLYAPGGSGPYLRAPSEDDFVLDAEVSARPFGGFVTAWQRDGTGAASQSRFLARFRDAAGEPAGEPIAVTTDDVPYNSAQTVLGLATGAAFAWHVRSPSEIRGRVFPADGRPQTLPFVVGASNNTAAVGLAALPNGGFVVGWTRATANPRGASAGRVFTAGGLPVGEPFPFSELSFFVRVAVSPAGDVIAALGGRNQDLFISARELWLRRTTVSGVPLGDEILVAGGPANASFKADLAFDLNGNLHVVYTDTSHAMSPVLAQGYDRDGEPLGPPVTIDAIGGYTLRTLRLPDGNFFNSLGRYGKHTLDANVTSLCAPGTSVCGDGVPDALCEQCDDGALNSDSTPDACRFDCRPAGCGDGVIDTDETCDDGNRTGCDGCSQDCRLESGLGCGDGVAYPACGELCDDGNATDGDGCSPTCVLERIPGGGSGGSDCHAEWSVDNAANTPRFDKLGRFSDLQTCTDNDPRCDFDGGVAGSCSFAIAVCVNNTNLPACQAEFRLRSWELRKPSASRAAHDPAAAAVRSAFQAVVPGTVVGPDARDLCSPRALVPLALKGSPAHPKKNKLTLVARASLYSGATDTDKLRLVCLPPSP